MVFVLLAIVSLFFLVLLATDIGDAIADRIRNGPKNTKCCCGAGCKTDS